MGDAIPGLSLPALVTSAFLVSLATVAIPGPITIVASRLALRQLPAAVWFLAGVTFLDVALFLALVAGASPVVRSVGDIPLFEVVGGLVLVWAGVASLRGSQPTRESTPPPSSDLVRGAGFFILGVAVAGGNPQYWLWWLTAGVALIQAARSHGIVGLAWMLAALIGGVVVWYVPLLVAVRRGRSLLSARGESLLLRGLAIATIVLGAGLLVVGASRL